MVGMTPSRSGPQDCLELLDRRTQRRLGDKDGVSGAGETAMFGESQQELKLAQGGELGHVLKIPMDLQKIIHWPYISVKGNGA